MLSYRVPIRELYKFLQTQDIPKVEHFLCLKNGRNDIFKNSIKEASKVDGLYLEFGVMSGGTTNQIAQLIPNKMLYGFDSWEGISGDYSEIHKKGTWIEKPTITEKNVELIKGYFQDTLELFLDKHKEKIAFTHITGYLYDSDKYVLDILAKNNRLQIGSIVQFDGIFYTENNYWYQDDFRAWNEITEKYNIKWEYLTWAGFCHCAYKIIKI